jgi:hypothetical protein
LSPLDDARVAQWLARLEARHLANLRVPEVTRALRALSSAYVERRHKVASGSTLDSAGKRAAFALYYGPLHFIAASHALKQQDWIVSARIAPARTVPARIVDLGCGTGVVGAACSLACAGAPTVVGLDRHPWAVDETRRTYRDLDLSGQARLSDLARLPATTEGDIIAAGYLLNELPETHRRRAEDYLLRAAAGGAHVLVIEPLARGVAPWWDATAARFAAVGGRAQEWRLTPAVPDIVATLGKAAGLSYRELRFRTLVA